MHTRMFIAFETAQARLTSTEDVAAGQQGLTRQELSNLHTSFVRIP